MPLVLMFHQFSRIAHQITDESTNVTLPEQGTQFEALMLKSPVTDMLLSLDMESRVDRGNSVLLHGRCLFCTMPDDLHASWLAESNQRPLHPHEMIAANNKLRGLLPEVVSDVRGHEWINAERLRAKCGPNMQAPLVIARGYIELVEWFGGVPAGVTERNIMN
jgi:hypothetical protein